jgi:uncharacterized protein YkwD
VKPKIILALVFSILLLLFLWLRPVVSELGRAVAPDVTGRPTRSLPYGARGGAAPSGPAAPTPARAAFSKAGLTHVERVEEEILRLSNEARAAQGLRPLQPETTLRDIARGHSDDMVVRDFFDHVNPDGLDPAARIASQHRQLIGLTGENIWEHEGCKPGASCDPGNAEKLARGIFDDWMHSSGHRANILEAGYTHLGVGVTTRDGKVTAAQDFAEVAALLKLPVPAVVVRDSALDLAAESQGGLPPVEKYDFWDSGRGLAAGDARDIAGASAHVAPGVYKMRFYVAKPGGGHVIYDGPQVEVKNP